MKQRSRQTLIAAVAGLALCNAPAKAQVVFSESFEAPVVTGFDDDTVPSNGKWIGATAGFGAANRVIGMDQYFVGPIFKGQTESLIGGAVGIDSGARMILLEPRRDRRLRA